jgi:glutaredoxin
MDRALIVIGILVAAGVFGVLWRARRANRANAIATRVDTTALGLSPDARSVVLFKGPLCHDCQLWAQALDERSVDYRAVDIVDERELSARHGISAVPVVLVVEAGSGAVLQRYTHGPTLEDVRRVIGALGA